MTLRYQSLASTLLAAVAALVIGLALPQPAAIADSHEPSGTSQGTRDLGRLAWPDLGASEAVPEPLGLAVKRALARDGVPVPGGPVDSELEQKLVASDGAANDVFGISVSLADDTALVGSVLADVGGNRDQGAAYVFTRDGATWTEQAKLTASDGAAGDQFGFVVSLAGDTAVVSAPSADVAGNGGQGAAWVFTRDGETWTEQAKLTASDGAAGDQFGISATVGGDTAVVGAWFADVGGNSQQGAAWVFTRDGGSWSEQAKLTASEGLAGDRFGYSVAVAGDTAVVGALQADVGANPDQGAAYVFHRSGGAWDEETRLVASDGAAGSQFGISVDLAGETVLVGAPASTVEGIPFRGAGYQFRRTDAGWTEQAKLTASDGVAFDQLGWSVRLDGDAAVLSAPGFNSLQGAAYVFTRATDGWDEHAKLIAPDGEPFAEFGFSVGVRGDTALVGASRALVDGNFDQGAAYAFRLDLPEPEPVVCDRTISGVHPGPLTVSDGVTCLAAGAQVLGEVNVRGGAGLVASAAVIQGPLSAVGATRVELAFNQVTGPVLVAGGTGTVSMFANQVTGSVSLVNNTTSAASMVSGNTIIGSLSCFGNQPGPDDHGLPNTATAGTIGQCATM